MPSALRVCPVPGCPEITSGGRCEGHKQAAERARGNAKQRGYGGKAWAKARAAVLRRDPTCVLCRRARATVADHWPTSRRDLVAQGVPDPDALSRLRGLCQSCDARQTAQRQPGGWAAQ